MGIGFYIFSQLMIVPGILKLHHRLEILRITHLVRHHPDLNYLLINNAFFMQRKDRKKYHLLDLTPDQQVAFAHRMSPFIPQTQEDPYE